MTSTNNIIQLAAFRAKIKVANLINDYEEMAAVVKDLVECQPALNKEELEWLSVAYNHCIKARHDAWSELKNTLDQEKEAGNIEKMNQVKTKLKEVENQMLTYCVDVLYMLEKKILPNAKNNSTKVLCLKLMGDHNRFLMELKVDDTQNAEIKCFCAYQDGYELATKELHITSPEYLSLILNYSLFVYEILKEPEKAKEMVINARDGVARQTNMKEPSKEALDILKILNENLIRWGVTNAETETKDTTANTSSNSAEEKIP